MSPRVHRPAPLGDLASTFWPGYGQGQGQKTSDPRSLACNFSGAQLLAKLEHEMSRAQSATVTKVLPPPTAAETSDEQVIIRHFPDLYGYRGSRLSHKEYIFYIGNLRLYI